MTRPNWRTQHPPACACALCEEKKYIVRQEDRKISGNEKCACGSGKKYQRRHGR